MAIIYALLAGFVLDLIFGDPDCAAHPVRLIGKLVLSAETFLRERFPQNEKGEKAAGLTLVVAVISFTLLFGGGILYIAYVINDWLYLVVQAFICFQLLAVKSLKKESMKVYNELVKNDLVEARKKLSMIVGRDTQNMNETQIIKAAVETVAENASDAVVAPMMYFALGGALAMLTYKAVNTMDSMVGYKNEKYINFGRYAAKLDDVANFVPSRFCAVMMIIASMMLKYDHKNALRIFKRDRKKHASPNSAQTESACAGALGVELGGNAYYFGELHEKSAIGDDIKKIQAEDIKKANKLVYAAAIISLFVVCALRLAFYFAI